MLGINGRHRECLLRYTRLLLQASQHNTALSLAQQAAAYHPQDHSIAQLHAEALRCAHQPRNASFIRASPALDCQAAMAGSHHTSGCGPCRQSGWLTEALEEYDRAARLGRRSGDAAFRETPIQVHPWDDCEHALGPLTAWPPATPPLSPACSVMRADAALGTSREVGQRRVVLQVGKARALGALGGPYAEAAALLVSEALRGDPEHEGALLEYVAIVLQRGHVADALRILRRLLVRSHGNARVRCAACISRGHAAAKMGQNKQQEAYTDAVEDAE